jgi:hypothetical protein
MASYRSVLEELGCSVGKIGFNTVLYEAVQAVRRKKIVAQKKKKLDRGSPPTHSGNCCMLFRRIYIFMYLCIPEKFHNDGLDTRSKQTGDQNEIKRYCCFAHSS